MRDCAAPLLRVRDGRVVERLVPVALRPVCVREFCVGLRAVVPLVPEARVAGRLTERFDAGNAFGVLYVAPLPQLGGQ